MKIIKISAVGIVILVSLNYVTREYTVQSEEPKAKEANDNTGGYKVYTFDVPQSLSFAGEEVPLDVIDVKERFDRELHVNLHWHSSTIFLIKRAHRWFPQIEPVLAENGIPDDFKYLALIESNLQNVISPKGAVGFWQFLKATGKEYGLEINNEVDERYHVLKSTEAACKYIIKARERYGSWTNAAASYNAGQYGLSRRLEEQKQDEYYDLLLNEETSRYVFRILAIKEIMENKAKYGYDLPESQLYDPEETFEVKIEGSVTDFAGYALDQNVNYKILKRYNPWLRKNTLTVSGKKDYIIQLPITAKK